MSDEALPDTVDETYRKRQSRQSPSSSFGQYVYVQLREKILDNVFPPGFQILETELASMLDVSRTPVREAMRRLHADGLVEVRPRHGMRVLPVSPDDMREIYEVLTSLETTAARLVAERGVDDRALQRMRNTVIEMDAALAVDDLERWARADEQFHLELLNACGNRRLIQMANTLLDQAHRARMVTLKLRPRPHSSNEDHTALVEAVAARDADRAASIHHEHRRRNMEMLVGVLRRHKLDSV